MNEGKSSNAAAHDQTACPSCPFHELRTVALELQTESTDAIQDGERSLHHTMLKLQQIELDRVNRDLSLAQNRYVELYAFSPTAFATCDSGGTILEANQSFYTLMGFDAARISPDTSPYQLAKLQDHLIEHDRLEFLNCLFGLTESRQTSHISLRLLRQEPTPQWLRLSLRRLEHLGHDTEYLVALTAEETEDESSTVSRTLLRELNHRIKNSMGLILSLLQLETMQGRQETHVPTLMVRIHAITKIYERLFQHDLADTLDLGQYSQDIFESMVLGMAGPNHHLVLYCSTVPLVLGAKRASNIGLILTELLSNALIHGFPGGWNGELGLQITTRDDEVGIKVWNQGQKTLPDDFDLQRHCATGLRVVQLLTNQLGGHLRFHGGSPTIFELTLPLRA